MTSLSRRGPHDDRPPSRPVLTAKELEAVRPRCTLLHDSSNGGKLTGSMPVTMIPRHHLIHALAAINVWFFRNEAKKTLIPPSSGDGKRAINLIGAQGLL